jgi:hypothetical protein
VKSQVTFEGLLGTRWFLGVIRRRHPEIVVDSTLTLKPRPSNTALIAWQFSGQPLYEWPNWVQSSCSLQRGDDGQLELRHERRSGAQIVYPGEWLVRDLDGGICFYTDAEIRKQFEIV